MAKRKKQMRGSVLVFSLIILTMLLISAITIASVSVVEKKSALATQKSVLAFQAADSGAERVLKVMYRDNSPTVASIPLNGDVGEDDLTQFARALENENTAGGADKPKCDIANKKITAKNNTDAMAPNADPDYSFEVTFYDNSFAKISCADLQWRDKVVRIKSEGFFRGISRVIEIGIRPRE